VIPVETIDSILAQVTRGDSVSQSLRDHQVAWGTFWDAVGRSPALGERYTRARAAQLEVNASRLDEICDEEPPLDDRGRIDSGWVSWQKNRIDTRKWLLSKLVPKKYGDRLGVEMDITEDFAAKLQAARLKVPAPDE
jgi:hypothetical protein